MKLFGTIGTFVVGAAVGFATCGALTVRGVLNSERHRKALADMVAEKLSEELFTERATPSRVSYMDYNKTRVRMIEPRGPIDIVFDNGADAETAFANIKEIVKEYEQVSVADVCDICDLRSSYSDTKYGWVCVSDMYIDKSDERTLHLPKPLPLK